MKRKMGMKQNGLKSLANGSSTQLDRMKKRERKYYAEILEVIRKTVDPGKFGAEFKTICRTRTGDVLLELKNTSEECRSNLSAEIGFAIGKDGSIRNLVPKVTLEIRGMDSYKTKEEVESAIRENLHGYSGIE